MADRLVTEIREQRQRLSLLELDRHALELRPLTHVFTMLSKRNANVWKVDNEASSRAPFQSTSASVLLSPAARSRSGVLSHSAVNVTSPQSATSSRLGRGGGVVSSPSVASLPLHNRGAASGTSASATYAHAHTSLAAMRAMWNKNYERNGGDVSANTKGSSSSNTTRIVRPASAGPSGRAHGNKKDDIKKLSVGVIPARKSLNPAFDAKTADAIQMGLLLAQKQKEEVARGEQERQRAKMVESIVRRYGETQAAAILSNGGGNTTNTPAKLHSVSTKAMNLTTSALRDAMLLSTHTAQRRVSSAKGLHDGASQATWKDFGGTGQGRLSTASPSSLGGVEGRESGHLLTEAAALSHQERVSRGGPASVYSLASSGGEAGAHVALSVDPFQAPPVPTLVDDPTAWLREWQKQSDTRRKMATSASLGPHSSNSKLALKKREALLLGLEMHPADTVNYQNVNAGHQAMGRRSGPTMENRSQGHENDELPPPHIGIDIIVPDTIVWESNIPKGWYYYDKRERLVCRRKVDTKAVQMALLEGAKYENDVVAVLYAMGQSTLGGKNEAPPTSSEMNATGSAEDGGKVVRTSSRQSTVSSSRSIASSNLLQNRITNTNSMCRGSEGSKIVTKAKAKVDSAKSGLLESTSLLSERGTVVSKTQIVENEIKNVADELPEDQIYTENNKTVEEEEEEKFDENENAEETEEEIAIEREQANLQRLKNLKFLSKAEEELFEDIQSRVLHCRFITAAELPSFLFDVGGRYREKGTCILQKFVYSVDVAHLDTFQAVWTPAATNVTRRQNINNVFDERIPIFQRCTTVEGTGAEYYARPVQITNKTRQQVIQACDAMVKHFTDTNPKHKITRMICYFRLAGSLQHHKKKNEGDDNSPDEDGLQGKKKLDIAKEERDQRLVLLFCSSARVLATETREYTRLSAKYRVALDLEVPIIVDEGEVADAQSRLIALGTGPDGAPVMRADAALNASSYHSSSLPHSSRSLTITSKRKADPFKTTNLNNQTFNESVMVAMTGSAAAASTNSREDKAGGAMIQSFLEANRHPHAEQAMDAADHHRISNESNTTKKTTKRSTANTANVLYDSVFTVSGAPPMLTAFSHGNTLHNTAITDYNKDEAGAIGSSPSSQRFSPERFGYVSPNTVSERELRERERERACHQQLANKEHNVTIKAVMDHVVTTENYLKGLITANTATGGRGYQPVGEEPVVGTRGRSGSVVSNRSSATLRTVASAVSLHSAAGSTGKSYVDWGSRCQASEAGDSPRRGGGGRGGVQLMLPRPKMLVGMNPDGTRYVVEKAIAQAGLKGCRAAYLDTIPQRFLTDAEKAELLCLKLAAVVGESSVLGGDKKEPVVAPSNARGSNRAALSVGGLLDCVDKRQPFATLSTHNDRSTSAMGTSSSIITTLSLLSESPDPTLLLKASFLQCAKDHLLALVYDCYSYYDQYRANLCSGEGIPADFKVNHNSGENEEEVRALSEVFTFYLSPAIETAFVGKAVPEKELATLARTCTTEKDTPRGFQTAQKAHPIVQATDSESESEVDSTTTQKATEQKGGITPADLLDRYKPRNRQKQKTKGKEEISRVGLPTLYAPVEALFAVFLARLSKDQSSSLFLAEDEKITPATDNGTINSPPALLESDYFLSYEDEVERTLTDDKGEVEFVIAKLAEEEWEPEEDIGGDHQERRRDSSANTDTCIKRASPPRRPEMSDHLNKSTPPPPVTFDVHPRNARECTDAFASIVLATNIKPPPPATTAVTFGETPAYDGLSAVQKATISGHPRRCANNSSIIIIGNVQDQRTAVVLTPAEEAMASKKNASQLLLSTVPSPPATGDTEPDPATLKESQHQSQSQSTSCLRGSIAADPSTTNRGGSTSSGNANPHVQQPTCNASATHSQQMDKKGDGGSGRYGLASWLRLYYSWDRRALAEGDEVLEVRIKPSDAEKMLKRKLLKGAGATSSCDAGNYDQPLHQVYESDSDFSDIDDGAQAHARINTVTIAAELERKRHDKEQRLIEKAVAKKSRSKTRLLALSRRMPHLLHHIVLKFLEELALELRLIHHVAPRAK